MRLGDRPTHEAGRDKQKRDELRRSEINRARQPSHDVLNGGDAASRTWRAFVREVKFADMREFQK